MKNIDIGENEQNQRLDRFLRKYLNGAPLGFIYKAIRKDVKVNGRRAGRDRILRSGDVVSLYIGDADLALFHRGKKTENVRRQFRIAYEDENILVVEKPAGLLTHGDGKEKKNHLTNQVISYLTATGGYDPSREKTFVPAPVNRLDRNTSGLVIFGRNYRALQHFNELIRERGSIRKFYLTIVCGDLRESLRLRGEMVKREDKNMVRVGEELPGGKTMETVAVPLRRGGGFTLAEVEILTGRTHQIRAQLAAAGYPVIGDAKYGDPGVNRVIRERFGQTTQLLHAWRLVFDHCGEGYEYLDGMEIRGEPPARFRSIEKEILK
ncbi:hypothetical protein BHK98_06295 [Hornefia porci]|uniref:RNA pseudouridylate synthase n=1 Tax=Hornefia porci TaxID=2652292 RepID=A0A1Q9JHL9_9FIRM|nr:RluA family pseudouridine synthase [Hornefia porci]OLR55708.1 hypothetical protein BHK98_06295 [Hornefia porci]